MNKQILVLSASFRKGGNRTRFATNSSKEPLKQETVWKKYILTTAK